MSTTLRLKVVGFANDSLHLAQPTGEILTVPVDWFDHADLLSIEKYLTSDISNWNQQGKLNVYVVVNVNSSADVDNYRLFNFNCLDISQN